MSTNMPTSTATKIPTALRKTAIVAGGLYLITFVAGIPPQLLLYREVLNNPAYIVSAASDTAVVWGALLELINVFACIGTAVVLYPVVKRQSEPAALGFVTARVMEGAIIVVGVISLLSIVTLRQAFAGAAGADAASMEAVGRGLIAIHDWTFLLGPGVLPGVNAALLAYVMYRSRLVPRIIPAMGLIGAPLILTAAAGTVLGINGQISTFTGIATAPIFLWELSLGLWLVVKGFNPSSITSMETSSAAVPEAVPVA